MTASGQASDARRAFAQGLVIPACPLALTAQRRFDERRQRALVRYYLDAGAGGLAVGVHTTQFAIREPRFNLFKPVLQLAAEELRIRKPTAVRIGGVCGATAQALQEAQFLVDCDYQFALLSLAALGAAPVNELIEHCRQVASLIPIVGFYLQPAVGGRVFDYAFWRRFLEIENVAAIKVAPFNRYQTIDVVRAVVESGRTDVSLYTGNDDNIVLDLLTPYRFTVNGQRFERHFSGGLLGQWAVWTQRAVEILDACQLSHSSAEKPAALLQLNIELTDANSAVFDVAGGFRGCIAGIHEVLRRQGLLEGVWCLDDHETLSPGQSAEIDRVLAAYPHLHDDQFVQQNLERWLS